MSDETKPSVEKSTEPKKNNTLLVILLVILAFGVVGLIYDRRVARPAVETAYDDLAALNNVANRKLSEVVTPEEVRDVVGREPVESFEDGDDTVEVFQWRSGLPIRTHKLYAVYHTQGGKQVFYRHAKYKYDKQEDLLTPVEDYRDDPASPGVENPAPSQRPDFKVDPAVTFAKADKDGDGVLRKREINLWVSARMDGFDKDRDGVISKEEYVGRIEVLKARAEGRAPSGGQGGGNQGSEQAEPKPEAQPKAPAKSDAESAGDAEEGGSEEGGSEEGDSAAGDADDSGAAKDSTPSDDADKTEDDAAAGKQADE